MNMSQTINVTGMTCQNCVRHVREALEALPGVRSAEVDLGSGRVELEAERVLSEQELTAALDEAGYALA
jgi:Cu2+-exporting ATPase